jgi:predicted ATPase
MITGLTIRNFKGIREIRNLPLGHFHVLVGPNGSGKSTFLDAIDLVRDCLAKGPLKAVEDRGVAEFSDLTWMRRGGNMEVEFWLDFGAILEAQKDNLLHYRLTLRQDEKLGVCVEEESLKQYAKSWQPAGKPFHFSPKVRPKRLLGKTTKGTDYFSREKGSYQDSFVFGLDKLTLAHTPPDEDRYPTANAVKRFLLQGIRYIQLNSRQMRLPCPTTRGTELELDGTNLARVVGRLLEKNGVSPRTKQTRAGRLERLDTPYSPETGEEAENSPVERWTDHLRYALPDLTRVAWEKRLADNAEFLVLHYANGLECPSWLASDGTLRMLALTLPAFLPPAPGIYMVEEPENGVHPKALEIILRSLENIPDSQMIVATHSPFVVQQVGIEPLLCFARDENGTRIVPGPQHSALKDWDGTPDLGIVFAAGVLE